MQECLIQIARGCFGNSLCQVDPGRLNYMPGLPSWVEYVPASNRNVSCMTWYLHQQIVVIAYFACISRGSPSKDIKSQAITLRVHTYSTREFFTSCLHSDYFGKDKAFLSSLQYVISCSLGACYQQLLHAAVYLVRCPQWYNSNVLRRGSGGGLGLYAYVSPSVIN